MTDGDKAKRLKSQVQEILASKNLEAYQLLVKAIAEELNITLLECAAAIAYLNEAQVGATPTGSTLSPLKGYACQTQTIIPIIQPGLKLVRYRLDLGSQHKVTADEIKKVLVEESGVDVKNIANVRIQDSYTLIDLPDEMPQEIFHHLRTIEINGKQLDIRRVKARNKKRGNRRHRQVRTGPTPPANGMGH